MYSLKQSSRQIPGIISYMEFFSTRHLAYLLFFGIPFIIGLLSLILNTIFVGYIDYIYYFVFISLFLLISISGAFFTILLYSKKAPILKVPPNGWAIQMNTFFNAIIGMAYLMGQVLTIIFNNHAFREVFFILGTILSYIIAFVIYFSFTTVGRPGYIILALIQPITAIIYYSMYTAQFHLDFFIRAMIFFVSCALLFAIPYRKGLFHVSNIYKDATGLSGYPFIRALILSMMTDGNDELLERYFDRVGVFSNIRIQYLIIRSIRTKKIKGLFIIPHTHFGPFKTVGSSDLPEQIYRTFNDIPGITVYHSTNDHTQNLTKKSDVDHVINRVKLDIDKINNEDNKKWVREITDFSRKISNSAKLLGTRIDKIPLIFITRHPLPSDDIEAYVGEQIRSMAKSNNFRDVMIIDAHNAITGTEVLIKRDSAEANDLINVSRKFFKSTKNNDSQKAQMLYGVAKDPVTGYSEKEGIGFGGIVVHLFKNSITDQKTALIHFDGNNAYIEIRSNILNMLQNRGIERGEITTSDSHTVARQLTSRGYSPIGEKIKVDFILEKIKDLLQEA
ncbi:MAG: DUF2070 family protein, partial [Promethearchaeota archaeon]